MDEVTRILVFTTVFTLSAVILLLLSFIISRRRSVIHKKQLLEKEFKTREEALLQVSRDLHDEIGSSLSGIHLLTQLAIEQTKSSNGEPVELLKKISAYTNTVIEQVSDMAWLMKPGQESLQLLLSKLKSYSLTTGASKNIAIHFADVPELPPASLTIAQRKAIYLISKEAINNAIKYSCCRNIFYTIHITGNQLSMEVKDDGKGFSTGSAYEGNGLKNMHDRAKEIEAELMIVSIAGKGTSIGLCLAITQSGEEN